MRSRGALALVAALTSCRGGAAATGASPSEVSVEAAARPAVAAVPDTQGEELWALAAEGDLADLARLHDREGAAGLLEHVGSPERRATVLAALACGDDFTALPFLAAVAVSGDDAEAEAAIASAASLAAVPRRARDPEDAAELRQGCEGLLALARAPSASRGRRAGAVSVLRMLADTGCLRGEPLPTDVDAK